MTDTHAHSSLWDSCRIQWQQAAAWTKWVFVFVLMLKVFLCLFTGHFDIYRFLVFLQHALAFPSDDPWAYRAINDHSDFPYPPALYYVLKCLVSFGQINATPPHEPPAGHLYSWIKIPILIADLVVAAWLVRRTNFRWMVLSYWLSGIVIFHQYYSGQYDLFVAAPLVMAFCLYEREAQTGPWGRSMGASALWLISVVLKPFALLFAPLYVLQQDGWRRRIQMGVVMLLIFALFKASEWPYSKSVAYREQMGAGAQFLLMNLKMHRQYWFAATYVFLLGYVAYRQIRQPWWSVAAVTLALGAFAFHSAGWMTWAAVTLPVVLFDQRASRLQLTLFGVWQVAFLLRWAYCPTSPLLDSISVFTDRFLDLDLRLPMGAIYARQPKMLGVDSFLFFGYAFAASSFALLLSILSTKKTS
ncbi:hypothetical protein [Aquabacterium sp.]|uniref:hypothetical protein n=1 Tax=Aquabacterium sp. TaxID=1872578 RepID=UPI0035B11158